MEHLLVMEHLLGLQQPKLTPLDYVLRHARVSPIRLGTGGFSSGSLMQVFATRKLKLYRAKGNHTKRDDAANSSLLHDRYSNHK